MISLYVRNNIVITNTTGCPILKLHFLVYFRCPQLILGVMARVNDGDNL